ncbi:C39 family peptidase [Candidatus Woesebacteria bacterium]|nr:C39 family peptidase [Candidatus Woesebacteria bacterium]
MRRLFPLLVIILFWHCVPPVSANELTFHDYFDANLEQWEIVSSQAVDWSVDDGVLTMSVNQPFTVFAIIPRDEYWTDSKVLTMEMDYLATTGSDKNVVFNYRDEQNWYEFHFTAGTVYLAEYLNGTYSTLAQESADLNNGQLYHIKLEIDENRVALSLDEAVVIEYEDSSLGSKIGKIALKVGTGAAFPTIAKFDNVSVTTIDNSLGVPLIKQNQSPWASMEYDSATDWVQPGQGTTMKNWGCALISAAMIMKFHDITKMPDGTPVNPFTLNKWLLENNGYFNGGNVSFARLAGLTKKLSDQYGSVALEYSTNISTPLQTAQEEIAADRPVIITKPGHFMVADGVIENKADLTIKDPAYSYTSFSQHKTILTSARRFVPSHTDVSYLEIVADPQTTITVFDSTNHALELTADIQHIESEENPGVFSPAVQVIELAKPAAGSYRIAVNAPENATETVITTISQNGDSTRHVVPNEKTEALLTISEHEHSTIEFSQNPDHSKIREIILDLWTNNEISAESMFKMIDAIITVGEAKSDKTDQLLMTHIIKQLITTPNLSQFFSMTAIEKIMTELRSMQNELELLMCVVPSPSPSPSPATTTSQ